MAVLPITSHDLQSDYDNAKFRRRSVFKVITQAVLTSNVRRNCGSCGVGKLLALLMIAGLAFLTVAHTNSGISAASEIVQHINVRGEEKVITEGHGNAELLKRFWRKPPRLPPRLPPHGKAGNNSLAAEVHNQQHILGSAVRQNKVAEAFRHAWTGYKNYAMGSDELMPLSKRGVDGLGGLGGTIVDSLDTAMIMGLNDIVQEAGYWIEKKLPERLNEKGQVNLFETTIRVLGGLLSAYCLSGGENGTTGDWGSRTRLDGPNPAIYLERAQDLADRLMVAFTSSPTPIPYSDVILRERSAHPAPDGLSSTSEVSSLQLEFWYLSKLSGNPKYGDAAMHVLEHLKILPKFEGLVPIYISPHSGHFSGQNIRLGSRGDSYYEYLIKVWLQQRGAGHGGSDVSYLREMYDGAIKGVKNRLIQKSIPKGLVFVGELPSGEDGSFYPKMDHLVCFLPGTLALGATRGLTKQRAMGEGLMTIEDIENLKLAEDIMKTCYEMYSVTTTGLAPEIAHFHTQEFYEDGLQGGNKSSEFLDDIIIRYADRHNLLRPETVESLFVLHRITQDPKYLEWGWQIFQAFESHTKVDSGGYSSLNDVTILPPPRRDKMETFFLGETLKYLYLLFGDSNVLPLDKFVFNTEAHPLPISRKGVENDLTSQTQAS
uniref:alpha-1,2-Mannosidase n=1 Tax=Juniperus phoenicea TaxID=61308 RepID=A0A3Q8C0J9_9CONI|nr:putative MNS3 [Juniperus phoenicea]